MFTSSLATFGIAKNSANSRTSVPSCDTRYSRTLRAISAAPPFALCAFSAAHINKVATTAAPTITIRLFTNLSPTPNSAASLPHNPPQNYVECGAPAPLLRSSPPQGVRDDRRLCRGGARSARPILTKNYARLPPPLPQFPKRESSGSGCQHFYLSLVPISYI